ncbi:MAG TPA: xylulose kinase [Thermoanaerobacterales bacterium]|nr:xylulose kinase [Thermoanaerobacterales bacterium]
MSNLKPPYVIGIDLGTSSVKVGIFDLKGKPVAYGTEEYPLYTPNPGWAEQRAEDWWFAICKSVRSAIEKGQVKPEEIVGIGADTTSCTVLLVDENCNPIRPAVLWMDVRSTDQAERIAATKHPALKYNGFGNVSAEWLPCKALWLKENEPENYKKAFKVIECIDWLNYKLTGEWTTSINTASIRGYYDNKRGGWPVDFYEKIGLDDIIDKYPSNVYPLGKNIGVLTKEAARDLGLKEGIPVGEGGADALIAMIGLNVVEPGRVAFITGSSHLLLGLSEEELHAPGIFGSYPDAVVPDLNVVEGGQVSTGSIVNWFKNNFCGGLEKLAKEKGCSIYDILNEEASRIQAGSEGLILLDYWQGNRTPLTDSNIRGMIYGLSLKHTPTHIYKAIIEGISYGTEHILRTFRKSGFNVNELYACGGAVKSKLWMQIHSDVSNLPIFIPEVSEAASLGSAILGAIASGVYRSIPEAAHHMVNIIDKIVPNKEKHEEYKFYVDKYIEVYPILKDWMHDVTRHQ